MATKISSREARRLLSNWKEDRVSISVSGVGSVSFTIRGSHISKVSEYLIAFDWNLGNMSILIDEEAEFEETDLAQIPDDILNQGGATIKHCLKISSKNAVYFLAQMSFITPSGDEKH